MPKRSIEKAIQGGLSLGAYGAVQGNMLKKKYGKKAAGIGAGVGAIVGATTGYLSGVPDPNMGNEKYDQILSEIRSNVMKNSRKTADIVGDEVANTYARRGVSGPAAVGVEAANRGRVFSQANESLIPIENQIAMMKGERQLEAERAGEYEIRQGWQDAALATGAAARSMVSDAKGTGEVTEVPSEFGSWSAIDQQGWLVKNGYSVPSEWGQMSAADRLSYIKNVHDLGVSIPDIKPPTFDMFKPAYTEEEDAKFNQEQYPLTQQDMMEVAARVGGYAPPEMTEQQMLDVESIVSGRQPGSIKAPEPTENRTNTVPTILHDSMSPEAKEQIEKTAHSPATAAEMDELRKNYPKSHLTITHPKSPFMNMVTEPYIFQNLQQTIALLGDDQFSAIMDRIIQIL